MLPMDCVVASSTAGTPAAKPSARPLTPGLIAVAAKSSPLASVESVLSRAGLLATKFARHGRETPRLLHLLRAVVATDLDTEHGGTDANKRDGARQLGRLNVDDLQL